MHVCCNTQRFFQAQLEDVRQVEQRDSMSLAIPLPLSEDLS